MITDGEELPPTLYAGFCTLRFMESVIATNGESRGPESIAGATARAAVGRLTPFDPGAIRLRRLINTADLGAIEHLPPLLMAYGEYLESIAYWQAAADTYAFALRITAAEREPELHAEGWRRIGYARRVGGDLEGSKAAFESSEAIARWHHDAAGIVLAQIGQVSLVRLKGDLDKALARARVLVGNAERLPVPDAVFPALHELAIVATQRRDHDDAVLYAHRAMREAARRVDRDRALMTLGTIFINLGRAEPAYHALKALERSTCYAEGRRIAWLNLMSLGARSGDRALFEKYQSRVSGVDPMANREFWANALIEQARGFYRFGPVDRGATLLQEARVWTRKHSLNRHSFEIDAMLAQPQPVTPEVAGVEAELRRLAAVGAD